LLPTCPAKHNYVEMLPENQGGFCRVIPPEFMSSILQYIFLMKLRDFDLAQAQKDNLDRLADIERTPINIKYRARDLDRLICEHHGRVLRA